MTGDPQMTSWSDDLAADVVVIGGGNAAMCAALAARERGAEVLVLERAPEHERGGTRGSPPAPCASSTSPSISCGNSCAT